MNYDVIWNTGNWPATTQPDGPRTLDELLRQTAAATWARAPAGRASSPPALQVTGLTVGTNGGAGRSGIIRWLNEGSASPIAGAYPAEDTAIVDPPSWFTAVPATYSVDARLPLTNFFLAGMWQNSESTTAPGAPFVVHGTEHRRHGPARELRDEPALPGGSGARVADGRRRRVLGGPVARSAHS